MSKTANLKDIKTMALILLFLFSSTIQSKNLKDRSLLLKDFLFRIVLDRAKARKCTK